MFERQVARGVEAANRKDVDAVMRYWADEGVLVLCGRSAVSGRYEGKAAIRSFFERLFDGLTEIEFTVRHVGFTNPVALTYRNTIFIEFHIHETNKTGTSIDTDAVAVLEVRRGKTVSHREFWFDPTAMEAIWGSSASASPIDASDGATGDDLLPEGALGGGV